MILSTNQNTDLTSGAERRPWPGRGSMMTSEKLFVVLERSSVELLEEGWRLSCPLAGRGGLEGTGGLRWLAVEVGGEAVLGGRSRSSHSGITRAGEARTESDLDWGEVREPGGEAAGGGGGGLRALRD